MDYLLELFHSEHDEDLMDVNLQMLQSWLVVAPPSKLYTVSTVLFHEYGGANFGVTNCISHFSMFIPTKTTMKMANGNTGRVQVSLISTHFTHMVLLYFILCMLVQ